MEFEEKWFEAETREGFYVESMMKRAWAAQLEVLKDIEALCQKYALTYFADWGTLLGAVRHKGFIPWDDDMDIAMKRQDYEVFLRVAPKELPEGYLVYNARTDKKWKESFSRVVNGEEISFEEKRLKKFHRCPYCVGIDIYPIDYLPRDEEEADTFCNLIKLITGVRVAVRDGYDSMQEQEENLTSIEEFCNIKIERNKYIENQLSVLTERLSQCYSEKESDALARLCAYACNGYSKVDKRCYDSVIWLTFENTVLPAPQNYDVCLKSMYGEDYMTPKEIYTHDYPFYKKQAEGALEYIKSQQKREK